MKIKIKKLDSFIETYISKEEYNTDTLYQVTTGDELAYFIMLKRGFFWVNKEDSEIIEGDGNMVANIKLTKEEVGKLESLTGIKIYDDQDVEDCIRIILDLH